MPASEQKVMTEKRLQELFEKWKKRLGLHLWEIELRVVEQPSGNNLMTIHRSTTYNLAIVEVPRWLLNGGPRPDDILPVAITPQYIEHGLVHELLHCWRQHSQAFLQDGLDGLLHRDVAALVQERYSAAMELEIENLAVALVNSWPK